MAAEPKVSFYVAVGLVIMSLVGLAIYRADVFSAKPDKPDEKQATIDPTLLGVKPDSSKQPNNGTPVAAEAHSDEGIMTAKEYTFKPSERLPEVKGTAAYAPLQDNTVKFALNVWAGWAPIIYANDGFKPVKVWKTPEGKEFKVELVLIDNPVEMRDSYAAGNVHIGWATLDMLPLIVDGFVDSSGKPKDSRIMPRVYQQIDWSNGGDGIVVRDNIKTVADLRGKQIALAQNSPSHYFLLNMLVQGGVQPGEVNMVFTGDAFQAAAAFNSNKDISAAVSWAPDIYKLSEIKGNRMLVDTTTANKLIADVWFARADFAKEHPDLCESLVRGIFDGMSDLKQDANKQKCAELMAEGYGLKPADALGMLGDAHSTNWAENYQFFLNQNNSTNFARVWNQAYYLYRTIRNVRNLQVPFDQVMDFSIIAKLGSDEKYKSQKDESAVQFVPKTTTDVRGAEEVLTNVVVIHFFPNTWDLHKKITKEEAGTSVETLYDPKVDYVIEEIGKLAGQFGKARIIIEGHTDSSMEGKIPEADVKELSLYRANSVKEAVIEKFKLDPNKFNVDGLGWSVPADASDALNQAKNRRVEIKVYTAEVQ